MITITRYHDISAGHRVCGHEGKCAHLHGHNYRVYFTCTTKQLDVVGRVMDFSHVKSVLCNWLEENWDHKFLLWSEDHSEEGVGLRSCHGAFKDSVVEVPFNPTAENMANYLLYLGNSLIRPMGVNLVKVTVWETRKCLASASLGKRGK